MSPALTLLYARRNSCWGYRKISHYRGWKTNTVQCIHCYHFEMTDKWRMFSGMGLNRVRLVSGITTCSPGLRGSMKRRIESALPNTTLECGAGTVVTAVMGFLASTASYKRICLPKDNRQLRRWLDEYSYFLFSWSSFYVLCTQKKKYNALDLLPVYWSHRCTVPSQLTTSCEASSCPT